MRALKIIEHISLDGVIQHSADGGDFPYSDWTAAYRTPAGRDAMLAAYGELPNAVAPPPSPVDLRVAASALYDSLRADQRRGDWRAYADHWDALGRLLGRPPR